MNSRIDPQIGRAYEENMVRDMQRKGATASEAMRYVMDRRKRSRKLRSIALTAKVHPTTLSRFIKGTGGTTLYSAELIANAMGYRLTLEEFDEKADSYVPDDRSYRLRDDD